MNFLIFSPFSSSSSTKTGAEVNLRLKGQPVGRYSGYVASSKLIATAEERKSGWVAERLKALVLKTSRRVSVSWVRIPPHPPPHRHLRDDELPIPSHPQLSDTVFCATHSISCAPKDSKYFSKIILPPCIQKCHVFYVGFCTRSVKTFNA